MSTSHIMAETTTKGHTNILPLSKEDIDGIYVAVNKKLVNPPSVLKHHAPTVHANKQAVFVGFINSVVRDAWIKTVQNTLPSQYSMVSTDRDTNVAITLTGVHADELSVTYAMKKLLNHERVTLDLLTELNAKCQKLIETKKPLTATNSNHL